MTNHRSRRLSATVLAAAIVLSLLAPAVVADSTAANDSISIATDGEHVTVANTTGQTISGSADLAAGTELQVTVQSVNDSSRQFYKQQTVTVDDNSWGATFDFSGLQAGDRFNVTVEETGGSATADATGEVVACTADCPDAEPGGLSIDTTDGNVTLANASSQVVSGTADARKGTEVNVQLQSTGDTQRRFFKVRTAVVTADGNWAVAFNFSEMPAGGTFEVAATIEDTDRSENADGRIVACEGNCTDQPPADTPTAIPEQTPTEKPTADDPAVALNKSAIPAVSGEVAAIRLSFNEADAAVVTVGDTESVNYELRALVRDADGDGDAVLYFDTALAGREGNPVSASAGDEVTLRDETELDSMLDAGSYSLTVHAGEDADGEPTTLGTLLVQESPESTATDGTPTATDHPEQGGQFDGLGGIAVSALFIVGGAVVALLLVRN